MTKRIKTTIYLEPDLYEKLRKISYLSRKSQANLIAEGLELLFRIPPKESK